MPWAHANYNNTERRVCSSVISVGDEGQEGICPPPPPQPHKKIRETVSGKYHVKFGHFVKFFTIFSGKIISCLQSRLSSYAYGFVQRVWFKSQTTRSLWPRCVVDAYDRLKTDRKCNFAKKRPLSADAIKWCRVSCVYTSVCAWMKTSRYSDRVRMVHRWIL